MSDYEQDGYGRLADEIIITAAEDYRKECRKRRKGDVTASQEIYNIEVFFNSEAGDIYSRGKAKEILRRLQKEQEQKIKKPRKTAKITKREIDK